MLKKLLFLGLLISISINFNYVLAETGLIIPLKKPSLSDNEVKDKISKNILKPIKKILCLEVWFKKKTDLTQ